MNLSNLNCQKFFLNNFNNSIFHKNSWYEKEVGGHVRTGILLEILLFSDTSEVYFNGIESGFLHADGCI